MSISYYVCTDCGRSGYHGNYGINHSVECSLGDLAVRVVEGTPPCSLCGSHACPTPEDCRDTDGICDTCGCPDCVCGDGL